MSDPRVIDLGPVVRGFQSIGAAAQRAAEAMLLYGSVFLRRPTRRERAVARRLATQQRRTLRRAERRRRRGHQHRA